MNAPDFRTMTAATIGKDLLSALVTELKLLPSVWAKPPKAKQDDIIDRLRDRVETNVKMAVHMLSAQGRTVVVGDLEQITIKDGAKAVIKVARSAESLHELYDAQGKAVLLVVSDAGEHTGGMGEVTGESQGLRWPLQGLDFAPGGVIGTSNEVSSARVRLRFSEN